MGCRSGPALFTFFFPHINKNRAQKRLMDHGSASFITPFQRAKVLRKVGKAINITYIERFLSIPKGVGRPKSLDLEVNHSIYIVIYMISQGKSTLPKSKKGESQDPPFLETGCMLSLNTQRPCPVDKAFDTGGSDGDRTRNLRRDRPAL